MAKNQMALPRYKVILKTLKRAGQHASKDIHIACINSGIDVSLRAVQKDLQNLRDDESIFGRNLNIHNDPKTKKWYSDGIPKEIFTLLELKDGEVTSLLFYAKTISQYSDYPIFQEISGAIKKVIESASISAELKELFEKETLLETEKHPPLKGVELIPELLDAIHNRLLVSIEYQRFDGAEIKKHVVKPIILKEDKQMWYLICENVKKERLNTFALDRMASIVVIEDVFDPIQFNSEEYFKYSFGITVLEGEPLDVIIKFDPFQGNYLKTLPIHPSQQVITDSEAEFTIQVTVIPSYEFYSKIRSYGESAQILSPDFVIEEVKKSFSEALNLYK
jgi:predicted DNA-binding transcriptional regulator YafY